MVVVTPYCAIMAHDGLDLLLCNRSSIVCHVYLGHDPYAKCGEPCELSRALDFTTAHGDPETHVTSLTMYRRILVERMLSPPLQYPADMYTSK